MVLIQTDMKTFYGSIKFSEAGNNIAKPMVLRQVQNGKLNVVAPSKWPPTRRSSRARCRACDTPSDSMKTTDRSSGSCHGWYPAAILSLLVAWLVGPSTPAGEPDKGHRSQGQHQA